jgi:hypothetical protein
MSRIIEYTSLTDQALIDLLSTEEDRLPRAAADEIIRRGVPMGQALVGILDDESAWASERPRWWAVVHAAYLLAAMQPPGAIDVMLRALDKADEYDLDWITNDARYLLGSFGPRALPALKAAALVASRETYPRILINEALGWIAQNHAEARDEVAQILRAAISDEVLEPDGRAFAACELLDFAMPEDRDLILSAADGWIFCEEDVHDVYSGESQRRKRPGYDWLQFYDEARIAERQERWREEDRRREKWESERKIRETLSTDVHELKEDGIHRIMSDENELTAPVPFRAGPRIGRNEPCPCKSGRKYKKCCGG